MACWISTFMNTISDGYHLPLQTASLKDLLQENDYMCKIDLKDAYFCIPLRSKIKKVSQISLGREPVRVPLPMFWVGTSTAYFRKNIEGTNSYSETNSGQNHNLSRRYATDDTQEGAYPSPGYMIFLLQNLGFVINQKNLSSNHWLPVQQIEFLGLIINSANLTLALPKDKETAIQKKCTQLLSGAPTIVLEISQLIGSSHLQHKQCYQAEFIIDFYNSN